MTWKILCLLVYLMTVSFIKAEFEADQNGYILYCPCMGRFGNQADHFLGVLAFAKGLNRTLVLPPWVEYRQGQTKAVQVSFDTYFKVSTLARYHRVLTMHQFMVQLAPKLWPPANRTVLCYMPRHNSDSCNAKEGNPFGPFWDTFDVEFTGSVFYRPLSYDVHSGDSRRRWQEQFPPTEWPVLAFTGAPASFPVQRENTALQKYLEWSEDIKKRADDVVRSFPRGPFVGIHLRNGVDWERACAHVQQSPNLFAAPQCLGYHNERGRATPSLCLPPHDIVVRQLRRALRGVRAKTVFVASDNDHRIQQLSEALRKLEVTVLSSSNAGPHVDLSILARSHHFIGNCISSFSAFAKRERDVHGLPSSFWAFPVNDKTDKSRADRHEEL